MTTQAKKEWTIYLIEAENGSLYTGITKDLERRFGEHEAGLKSAKFFRSSPPKAIRFSAKGLTHSQALRLEHAVKSLTRLEKERLIQSGDSKTLKRLLK